MGQEGAHLRTRAGAWLAVGGAWLAVGGAGRGGASARAGEVMRGTHTLHRRSL